jgi:hypothetical protein
MTAEEFDALQCGDVLLSESTGEAFFRDLHT